MARYSSRGRWFHLRIITHPFNNFPKQTICVDSNVYFSGSSEFLCRLRELTALVGSSSNDTDDVSLVSIGNPKDKE